MSLKGPGENESESTGGGQEVGRYLRAVSPHHVVNPYTPDMVRLEENEQHHRHEMELKELDAQIKARDQEATMKWVDAGKQAAVALGAFLAGHTASYLPNPVQAADVRIIEERPQASVRHYSQGREAKHSNPPRTNLPGVSQPRQVQRGNHAVVAHSSRLVHDNAPSGKVSASINDAPDLMLPELESDSPQDQAPASGESVNAGLGET